MTNIDWSDPVDRLRLVEKLGAAQYNEAYRRWLASIVVATVNGRNIHPVQTKYGRLYAVSNTGKAFATQQEAENYAAQLPNQENDNV
jgi:hypothetical protein